VRRERWLVLEVVSSAVGSFGSRPPFSFHIMKNTYYLRDYKPVTPYRRRSQRVYFFERWPEWIWWIIRCLIGGWIALVAWIILGIALRENLFPKKYTPQPERVHSHPHLRQRDILHPVVLPGTPKASSATATREQVLAGGFSARRQP
jgi:hypothetical protein